MKNIYHFLVLFLINIMFLNYSMQPLSVGALEENKEDLKDAFRILSPTQGQTLTEAYVARVFNRASSVSFRDDQEQEAHELGKLKLAYTVLQKSGLADKTEEEFNSIIY